jgi:hypothetical protein
LNLLFLFFLLGVAQKTMKSGAIPTFRLGMLCAVVVAMLLVKTGLYYQSYVESYGPQPRSSPNRIHPPLLPAPQTHSPALHAYRHPPQSRENSSGHDCRIWHNPP